MTTTSKQLLPPYGQPAAWDAPTGIPIWGARWIYPDDQVYDRQGFNDVVEGREQLQDWLNHDTTEAAQSHPIALAMHTARQMGPTMGMHQASKTPTTLYEDEQGIIRGNPNASYGYLYVAAWLK